MCVRVTNWVCVSGPFLVFDSCMGAVAGKKIGLENRARAGDLFLETLYFSIYSFYIYSISKTYII